MSDDDAYGHLRAATNEFSDAKEYLGGISNVVLEVFYSYSDLVDLFSFDIRSLQEDSYIQITPQVSFGGVDIDHIYYTDYNDLIASCGKVFSVVWIVGGAFFLFVIFVKSVKLAGTVIISLQKILGLLLS